MAHALPLALVLALAGCASTWKAVYAGARTSADFVDQTHERAWSLPLGERVDECGQILPPDASRADVDACLGVFVANPKVLEALVAYNAAADVLAAALLATDPEAKDQSAVLDAWGDVLAAARDLLVLFPDGERFVRQLDAIAGRVR